MNEEFIPRVQKRGAEIIEVSGRSSVASAAIAICNHVHDLFQGSDKVVSMGVFTDEGIYGVKDLVFSFPCICEGQGKYKILKDWKVDEGRIKQNIEELEGEFKVAQEHI